MLHVVIALCYTKIVTFIFQAIDFNYDFNIDQAIEFIR